MANSRKSRSSDLNGRVEAILAPRIPQGGNLLAGLSGGLDSVVLLHLLSGLAPCHGWKLTALHVHHGISPQADAWAEFCGRFCAELGIPLKIERVDIKPLRALGVEAAARELRHAALARQPVEFIVLAHHQDDQAETLLLQLLRGAGVKGAAAMAPSRQAGNGPAWLRPLLETSRADLEAYAAAQGLSWVEDESNADEAYPRNFLRHSVLPLLESRFPACRATLARAARNFAEADALLDALAEQDAVGNFDGETLTVAGLAALEPARAKNLLRWFIHRRGARQPEQARLEEMLRQLIAARPDSRMQVDWGEWEMHRFQGRVHVFSRTPEPGAAKPVTWSGEAELALPQGILRFMSSVGAGVSVAKIASAPVTIRVRQGAERLRPDAARPGRSLRYLFQAHGIPPWQRAAWPLLYCGESLAAAPGIGVDIAWQAGPGEAGVVLRWMQG